MIILKFKTPVAWANNIAGAMDVFLPDHAAAEKKASSMAMTMVAHYPDKPELVAAMIDLALEELSHFRAVVKIMHERARRFGGNIEIESEPGEGTRVILGFSYEAPQSTHPQYMKWNT